MASAGLSGNGQTVTVQITTAIQALDSTVTLENGPIKLIIDEVDGKLNQETSSLVFTDDFVHTGDYNTKMGELAEDIAEAKKAGTDAAAAAEAETKARIEAIGALDMDEVTTSQAGEVVTFIGNIKQVDGKVIAGTAELKFNTAYNADTNKAATMADVTSAVADLNGAMHFRGVVPGESFDAAVAGKTYAAGDVVIYGITEYVYDGSNWVQLGDEGLAASLINALDVPAIAVGADSTLVSISENDGKIEATATKIQIAESQVTNLESDLQALREMDAAQQLMLMKLLSV